MDRRHRCVAAAAALAVLVVLAPAAQAADETPPSTLFARSPGAGALVTVEPTLFEIVASEPGVTYECTLDGVPRTCRHLTYLPALTPGPHTFTAAARDAAGNLDPSPATRTWYVPQDDPVFTLGTGWTRATGASYFRGTITKTKTKYAAIRTGLTDVKQIRLVASTGPGIGVAAVYFRGVKIKTLDLSAATSRTRLTFLVATFPTAMTGTLVVKSASKKELRIDGVGTR